jgi:hypothetical protein
MYRRDYDFTFKSIFAQIVDMANRELWHGVDLTKMNSNLPFIEGMFKNSTVSPFVSEEFLYFGFTFFTDGTMTY